MSDSTSARLTIELLSGPITEHFDCGREAQSQFLYEHAWEHQEQGFSKTYILRRAGKLAGFVTLALSEIRLEPNEKPEGAPFATLPAIKLAQMGIAVELQGNGLGQELFAFAIGVAIKTGEKVGCRYLILDSVPENVGYYESKCGCVANEGANRTRRKQAENYKRDPNLETVSMRFDLRFPGQLNPSSIASPKAKSRVLATLMEYGATRVFVTFFKREKSRK